MPAGFSDEERARIVDALLSAGYELFTTQGLRKTSMEELTSRAGIAKSSFYAFFDSKEQLYLELMIRQAPEIAEQALSRAQRAPDARDAVAAVLNDARDTTTRDPLYRRLLTHPDELEAVSRRVGADEAARIHPHVVGPTLELVERWQREGQLVRTDPELVLGVIRAAGLIALHREEFGRHYDQVAELLTHALATGLTTAPNKESPTNTNGEDQS